MYARACVCVCKYIHRCRWQMHNRQGVQKQKHHLVQQQHYLNSRLLQVCIPRVVSLHLTYVVTLPVSLSIFLFCMSD